MNNKAKIISCNTVGELWLKTSNHIMKEGKKMMDDNREIREALCLFLVAKTPDPEDEIIEHFGDPKWLKWMNDNFFEEKEVPELDNAKSYAVRLFNYGNKGIDQIAKVIEKLKNKPESKSATITTFMPLVDTSYIPCVSLLDFHIRDGKLKLIVYARSLDFGNKAYANLVALARIQQRVARALNREIGELSIFVKSAHIYREEFDLMKDFIKRANG